jgi:transcription termination/antitermination protein NusA
MSVNYNNLKEAIKVVCEQKDLEVEEVIKAMEVAIASAYRKEFGNRDYAYIANFDTLTGKYSIDRIITVVDKVTNPAQQYSLVEARLSNPIAQIGDVIKSRVEEKDEFAFGRIASQVAKQVLSQTVQNVRHGKILQKFKNKIGEIVNIEIDYYNKGGYYVKLGQTTSFLSKENLMPIDRFKSGSIVKALIVSITEDANGNSKIVLSRSHPDFVKAILKEEIPEINNGLVEINKIVREAGVRTKLLVSVTDDGMDLDPVGCILGKRNMRIINVTRQISTTMMEKIDVIEYQPNDLDLMIMDALEPAQVEKVVIDEENNTADIICYKDEAALAVGKKGSNIRLAQALLDITLNIVTINEDEDSSNRDLNDSEIDAIDDSKNPIPKIILD